MSDKQQNGSSRSTQQSLIRNVGYSVALVLVAIVAGAAVPYVFQAGAPIRAAEMNANLQYLESLAASQGNGELIRVTSTVNLNSQPIFTVPADAAAPYILRSVSFGGCGGAFRLSAGGLANDGVGFSTEHIGTLAGLAIPFAPGETINAYCGTSNPAGQEVWLVFSK